MKLISHIKQLVTLAHLFFLLLLLATAPAFAQTPDLQVCEGQGFMLTSKADAQSISGGVTYTWYENGIPIDDSNTPSISIPEGREASTYKYVRWVASDACSDGVPSNTYTVVVYNCVPSEDACATATFIDPRDNQAYKVVRMPDERVWFAQNLNYQKGLTWNEYTNRANNSAYTTTTNGGNGVPAIGSYWCPGAHSVTSSTKAACDTYGALYTWETVMMVDGKFSDKTKTDTTWNEGWVSNNYQGSDVPAGNQTVNNARDIRGICPAGWHVPTYAEWATLFDKVEGAGSCSATGTGTTFTAQANVHWNGTNAGKFLKSSGLCDGDRCATDDNPTWQSSGETNGVDAYGFGVKPTGNHTLDNFADRGYTSHLWSSSVVGATAAWYPAFYADQAGIARSGYTRSVGLPVRCIMN